MKFSMLIAVSYTATRKMTNFEASVKNYAEREENVWIGF